MAEIQEKGRGDVIQNLLHRGALLRRTLDEAAPRSGGFQDQQVARELHRLANDAGKVAPLTDQLVDEQEEILDSAVANSLHQVGADRMVNQAE